MNTNFGDSWTVVIATGEAVGTASSPTMELDIIATSLGSTNDLTVIFADNNLGPTFGSNNVVSQFIGQPVNLAGDVVTFETYFDRNNSLAALTSLLSASGNLVPGSGDNQYISTQTNSLSLPGPYSLSEVVRIAGGRPATYSLLADVQVSSACIPPVATPLIDQTVCAGGTAMFSTTVQGGPAVIQWYQGANILAGQTNNTLTLSNVTAGDGGIYSVVVAGACGNPVTNSAVLLVNQNVSVAPIASVTNSIGSSVTFTAVASGTGPFTYQWFKGSTALSGQTNSTLTLNNLQPADSGAYSVSVTGACGNAASVGAVLTVNLPPIVTITHPTNGAVFVAPATFQVTADASDPDGTVTNVAFFMSTNGVDFVFIGETNATPYQTIVSNLPVGQYTFVAQATDNFGATGNSAPVTVNVIPPQPPTVTVVGKLTLNLQDGFQWLTNVVCNPVEAQAKIMVVSIHNITNSSIRVVNATGTNNGVPFVASAGAIQPGTCWTNVIKFYDPLQVAFFPVLTVDAVDSIGAGPEVPVGTPQPIFSGRFLRDGTFLVEFSTVAGSTYYVQYSSDMQNWNTVFPPYAGTGQHFQFVDSGPPQTQSLPSTSTTRFYRVLRVQ